MTKRPQLVNERLPRRDEQPHFVGVEVQHLRVPATIHEPAAELRLVVTRRLANRTGRLRLELVADPLAGPLLGDRPGLRLNLGDLPAGHLANQPLADLLVDTDAGGLGADRGLGLDGGRRNTLLIDVDPFAGVDRRGADRVDGHRALRAPCPRVVGGVEHEVDHRPVVRRLEIERHKPGCAAGAADPRAQEHVVDRGGLVDRSIDAACQQAFVHLEKQVGPHERPPKPGHDAQPLARLLEPGKQRPHGVERLGGAGGGRLDNGAGKPVEPLRIDLVGLGIAGGSHRLEIGPHRPPRAGEFGHLEAFLTGIKPLINPGERVGIGASPRGRLPFEFRPVEVGPPVGPAAAAIEQAAERTDRLAEPRGRGVEAALADRLKSSSRPERIGGERRKILGSRGHAGARGG